jgi:hypothetical protein
LRHSCSTGEQTAKILRNLLIEWILRLTSS